MILLLLLAGALPAAAQLSRAALVPPETTSPGRLAAAGEPSVAVTPSPPTTDYLRNLQVLLFNYSRYIIEPALRSGDSAAYHVTIDPMLHGMISAIQSTGDAVVMTQLISFVDTMVSKSISIKAANPNEQPYPGWSDSAGSFQGDIDSIDTLAAMARAAALIVNSPTWKTQYADKAQKYIQVAVDGGIRRYYTDAYGGKVPWTTRTVWDEAASHFGVLATCLWQATGQAFYRDLAVQIGSVFKPKLSPNGAGWIWDNGTIPIGSQTGNQVGVPDTQTAASAVRMVAIMYDAGLVFTRADVDRMASTLTDIIWNGAVDNPQFANYINGSNKAFRGWTGPGDNGLVTLGWGMLSRYSQKAYDALDKLMYLIFVVRPTSGSGRWNFTNAGVVSLRSLSCPESWLPRVRSPCRGVPRRRSGCR